MKTRNCATGIALGCLMMLSGCSSAPPSPGPEITYAGCPKVSSCPIPGNHLATNGDLSADIRQLEHALIQCALQIEAIKQCQEEHDVKTRPAA
ncbi:MAG: Rz1-like lysis system protein LysC [Serratia rubidaea]|nr:Rz1-like lysis system protein LysC [Serratia rubidaea]MCA4821972.1 Rz1-like lysis system protein LysC [Serratia rubidaea]